MSGWLREIAERASDGRAPDELTDTGRNFTQVSDTHTTATGLQASKKKKRENILSGTNGEGPSSRNAGERSHWGFCPAALLLLSNPLCGLPPHPHSDVGSFGRSCGGRDARVGLVGVP